MLLEIFFGVRGPIQMLQLPNAAYRCVLFGLRRVFFKHTHTHTTNNNFESVANIWISNFSWKKVSQHWITVVWPEQLCAVI